MKSLLIGAAVGGALALGYHAYAMDIAHAKSQGEMDHAVHTVAARTYADTLCQSKGLVTCQFILAVTRGGDDQAASLRDASLYRYRQGNYQHLDVTGDVVKGLPPKGCVDLEDDYGQNYHCTMFFPGDSSYEMLRAKF